MIDGKILIEKLLRYAVKHMYMNPRDVIYFRNLLLREFKIDEPTEDAGDLAFVDALDVPDMLVADIESFAIENGLCEEGFENLYSTYIMGILTPVPSEVNRKFLEIKEKQGEENKE